MCSTAHYLWIPRANGVTTPAWNGGKITEDKFDGLMQDCSNSSALAMELLQFCTKPLN